MLNCGGIANLNDILQIAPGVVLYVFDSHMPFHHRNINDMERIIVLDWSGDKTDVPADGDSETWDEYRDDDDFEEDEVEDDNNNNEEPVPEDNDNNNNGDNDESVASPARSNDGNSTKKNKENSASRKRKHSNADDKENIDNNETTGINATSPNRSSAAQNKDNVTNSAARSSKSSNTDDDNDEFHDDDNDSDSEQHAKLKRLRRQRKNSDDEEEDELQDRSTNDEFDDAAELRASRQRIKRTVDRYRHYYFEHQRYGFPVSFLIYDLAEQLNKCRNDILWLVCVGCTAPFINEQMSRTVYMDIWKILAHAVQGRNIDSERPVDNETGEVIHAGRDGFIGILPEEPRFILHRHWNLYDSMQYNDYIATRLCINIDNKGTTMLDKLIAKIGIPTKTCKQAYIHMLTHERETFIDNLKRLLDDDIWRMPKDQLFYPSFERHVERETPRSAADVVYSLNGLLSAGNVSPAILDIVLGVDSSPKHTTLTASTGGSSNVGNNNNTVRGNPPSNGSPGSNATIHSSSKTTVLDVSGWASYTWKDNFAKAYSSLSRKGTDLFDEGINYAKALRTAIARVAPAVVRAGCVHNAKYLRWIEIDSELTDTERRLFAQPIALTDLGRMLIRIHRDTTLSWRNRKGIVESKPLLLTLRHGKLSDMDLNDLDENSNIAAMYLTVMGLPVPTVEGGDESTNFMEAFRQAAESTGARFRIESFDSATMLLDARDLSKFLQYIDPGVAEASG